MGMSHLNGPCAPPDHPGSLSKQPLFCGFEQGREQGSNGTGLWEVFRPAQGRETHVPGS